jgi:hypothetical protein
MDSPVCCSVPAGLEGLWDEDRVRLIVGRAVEHQFPSFRHFPEFDADDLHQLGVLAVRERFNAGKWSPNACAFSTFAYRTARCRIIDCLRKRSRQAGHEAASRRDIHLEIEPGVGRVELAPAPVDEDLADWLGGAYAILRRGLPAFPPQPPRSGAPPLTTPAQRAALALFKLRLKLSNRNAAWLLAHRRDLRDAVGIPLPPSRTFFARLPESDTKLRQYLRRIVSRAEHPSEALSYPVYEAVMGTMTKQEREWDWTPEQTSEYLGVAESTLETWRRQRKNLSFSRVGTKPRYCSAEVRKFHAERCVFEPAGA